MYCLVDCFDGYFFGEGGGVCFLGGDFVFVVLVGGGCGV